MAQILCGKFCGGNFLLKFAIQVKYLALTKRSMEIKNIQRFCALPFEVYKPAHDQVEIYEKSLSG